MKRLFGLFVSIGLSLVLLSACAQTNSQPAATQNSPLAGSPHKISVVCDNFAAYDFARQVIGECGDRFELHYLTGSGVDLHSYQPSVEDVATINKADLFIYVGGESDEWARDIAHDAPELNTVSMLDAIGAAAVEEETVEGMADDHDHDEADHEHDSDNDDSAEYDEHVWLSLKNAQAIVDAIANKLALIDADSANTYAEHAASYNAQLAELDQNYQEKIAAATYDTLIFADRFPFRYLIEDYHLNYFAAFPGCSAETEASFEVVSFLANKLDELALDSVLVLEDSDQALAQTIINSTKAHNQQILVIDSLQSASTADIEAGKTYLSTMQDNLIVIADALT